MSMDLSWKIGVRIRPLLQSHRGSAITLVNHMHSVVYVVISVSILCMVHYPIPFESKFHIHTPYPYKKTSSHGFDLKFHGFLGYNLCQSYAFSCLHFHFSLHLMCGPLPYTIKRN
jgi:hypothetical protein